MTASDFFGSLFITFGPLASAFYFGVAYRAYLTVVSVAAGCFWLLGSMVATLFWLAVVPLRDSIFWTSIVYSASLELARMALFWGIMKGEKLTRVRRERILSEENMLIDLTVGVSFAVMSALATQGPLIDLAMGPGTIYTEHCNSMSIFWSASLQSFMMSICHIAWSFLAWRAYHARRRFSVALAFALHILAAIFSSLSALSNGCVPSLLCMSVLTIVSVVAAYRPVRKSIPSRVTLARLDT